MTRHPEVLAPFARASKDDGPGRAPSTLAATPRPASFEGRARARPRQDDGTGREPRSGHIRRSSCTLALVLTAVVPAAAPPAAAQDVPGIELCSRESRMDRRTGCLQSNVEYLQQLIVKNALDTQQKLAAANREIAAQRDSAAAAAKEIAALRDAVADLKAQMAKPPLTPAAAASKEIAALRDALTDLKARMDQAQKAKPDGK
jgi:hypothetical protein